MAAPSRSSTGGLSALATVLAAVSLAAFSPLFQGHKVSTSLFRTGVVTGALALSLFVTLAISTLRQRNRRPRLRISMVPEWPLKDPAKERRYLKKGYRPYDVDLRSNIAGLYGSSGNVYFIPLRVKNHGHIAAVDTQAAVIEIAPEQFDHLPIPLSWRRMKGSAKLAETIPPRGGTAEVCLIEWTQTQDGYIMLHQPWAQWRTHGQAQYRNVDAEPGPATVNVEIRVWCDDVSRKLRLRFDRIGTGKIPVAKRLRWWHRG